MKPINAAIARLTEVYSDLRDYQHVLEGIERLEGKAATFSELSEAFRQGGGTGMLPPLPREIAEAALSLLRARADKLKREIPPSIQVRLDDPEEIPSGENPER